MKKIISLIFLSILFFNFSYAEQYWSNKKELFPIDFNLTISNAKKFLATNHSNLKDAHRNIQGIWESEESGKVLIIEYGPPLGRVNEYRMYIMNIESFGIKSKKFNGTWEATLFKIKKENSSKINKFIFYNRIVDKFGYYTMKGSFDFSETSTVFRTKFDKKTKGGFTLDETWKKVWPISSYDYFIEKNKILLFLILPIFFMIIISFIITSLRNNFIRNRNLKHATKFKNYSEFMEYKKKIVTQNLENKKMKKLAKIKKLEKESHINKEDINKYDLGDSLKRLKKMYSDGHLTKVEFEKAKNKLLK